MRILAPVARQKNYYPPKFETMTIRIMGGWFLAEDAQFMVFFNFKCQECGCSKKLQRELI